MKLIRKIHLYSGIFMFPFVLLYGFTGWFFNHPRYFTGDQVTTFMASDVVDGRLGQLATPDAMAAEIVDDLNRSSSLADGPLINLTDARAPQFNRFFSYTVTADNASHQVSLDPITGAGEIRTTYSKDEDESQAGGPPANPLETVTSATIAHNALAEAQELFPKILTELELPSADANSGRRAPGLVFSAEVDGVPSVVTYNLGTGAVSALREDSLPATEVKSFLQRMHMARMYSPHYNIKWLWALQVDLMFVSMVFWALSGLLMWWQLKKTRLLGSGFFIVSILSAVVLTVGMHDQLATAGRRGGPAKTSSRGGTTTNSGRSDGPATDSGRRGSSATSGGRQGFGGGRQGAGGGRPGGTTDAGNPPRRSTTADTENSSPKEPPPSQERTTRTNATSSDE
ncbi:MAG: hypothetical protein GY903_17310 [Fuerstiella sp.]|nr:hypothetical protein [Fuerstiella sp.]MCP4856242.1 hypothetical protein [Fuerstiella sp.]